MIDDDREASEAIESLVSRFITDGLELGLVPPVGAVVVAVSDGDQVVRIASSLSGFGTSKSGDSIVGIETTVTIGDMSNA